MRSRFTFSLVVLVTLLVTTGAFAQATEQVTVQAQVQGIIEFIVTDDGTDTGSQVFDFGPVDALGLTPGHNADSVTPNAAGDAAVYLKNSAFLWSFRSAPRGAGTIVTAAGASIKSMGTTTVADSAGRTSMGLNQLEVRFSRNSNNVSGTLQTAFTALSAAAQNWLSGATIGAGNNTATGRQGGGVDLQLTVDDLDLVEPNEWQITFTANVT